MSGIVHLGDAWAHDECAAMLARRFHVVGWYTGQVYGSANTRGEAQDVGLALFDGVVDAFHVIDTEQLG